MKTYEDLIATIRKIISQELARARPDLSKYALNSPRFLRMLAIAKFVGLEDELRDLLDTVKVIDELQTITSFNELNRMALASRIEKKPVRTVKLSGSKTGDDK